VELRFEYRTSGWLPHSDSTSKLAYRRDRGSTVRNTTSLSDFRCSSRPVAGTVRSAVRRTGRVLGGTVLNHYIAALVEIARTGLFAYWSREFRPYLQGAARTVRSGP
jgi:hypothetical protein